MNKSKIPTILGILILVLGAAAGILATQYKAIFKLGASPDLAPQDVRITNITDNSITISWITDKATIGAILWGETPSLGKTTTEEDQQSKNIHSITLSPLFANLNYYFKINSGGETFDNSSIPWQSKTGVVLEQAKNAEVISGSVLTQSGQPAANVLIYLTGSFMSSLSAKTSASGGFIIPTSSARKPSLSAYADLNSDSSLAIFVQGGPTGVSTAQISKKAANPIPPMTLGQTYDFRNNALNETTNLPEADLNLPANSATGSSGFKIPSGSGAPASQKAVTVKSVKEGEVITTQKPQFFGDAPPNTKITITVQSTPVTQTVSSTAAGSWNWSPPSGLEPGSHTLTIQWRDAQGILRTLTRNFVVSAQEGPAFESTPSGTQSPTPTVSPKPTSSPTPTPKPSATPSPSASPRVSIPSTESGTPVAGDITPTIVLFLFGFGLIVSAIYIGKKSLE